MKPLFKTRYTTRQTTMTHKQSKSTIPYPVSARIFTWLLMFALVFVSGMLLYITYIRISTFFLCPNYLLGANRVCNILTVSLLWFLLLCFINGGEFICSDCYIRIDSFHIVVPFDLFSCSPFCFALKYFQWFLDIYSLYKWILLLYTFSCFVYCELKL